MASPPNSHKGKFYEGKAKEIYKEFNWNTIGMALTKQIIGSLLH